MYPQTMKKWPLTGVKKYHMLCYVQSEVPITATDAAVDQVVKLLKELEPLCPTKVKYVALVDSNSGQRCK
jgi:hypothetical protein